SLAPSPDAAPDAARTSRHHGRIDARARPAHRAETIFEKTADKWHVLEYCSFGQTARFVQVTLVYLGTALCRGQLMDWHLLCGNDAPMPQKVEQVVQSASIAQSRPHVQSTISQMPRWLIGGDAA